MKNIICFPHRLGQKKIGVEHAPALLLPNIFKKYSNINFNIKTVSCNNNFHNNINNLYYANKSLIKKEQRINLGGDHSMSIASVAHSLNVYPETKVIWIDAHADINSYDSSTSKNKHGMPLSFLTGLDKKYKRFNFIKTKLPYHNLLYIGLRETDPFEKKIINNNKINYISCDELNDSPINIIFKLQQFIKPNDIIHLSFDVDVFDPSIFPHTGTIVQNGANLHSIHIILNYLFSFHKIYNIDIAEINPFINKNNLLYNIDVLLELFKPLFNKRYL